jgi:4a-hydroxytetrahydrobiopterin dehydratase
MGTWRGICPVYGRARLSFPAMAAPLTPAEIEDALASLPAWRCEGDALRREYRFNDFKEALSFIVRIGLHAEELGHHPEIFNVYSTVRIALNTHDAGGKVTERDVRLAKIIEDVNWS